MVGVISAPLLAQLQIVDRRELGMLDARLTALEVFEIDLGNLDAGVSHQPREAIDLAAALQPGAGEGMAELVRRHWNVSDARRLFDTLENLLDAPGRQRLARDARKERPHAVIRRRAMLIDVLPDEFGRGGADADFTLFAPLAEDFDVALVEIVESDATEFTDAHAGIQQDQHQDVVTEAERGGEVAGAKEGVQMVMGEGDDHAARLGGLVEAKCGIAPDHLFIHQPLK